MDSGGGAVEADREAGREADREADREPDREPDREGEGGNQWSIFSRIPSSGQVLTRFFDRWVPLGAVGCRGRWLVSSLRSIQPSKHPVLV